MPEEKTLGELCSFVYGASLPSQTRREGNVAVVGSAGQVGWHNARLVPGPGIVIGRKGTVGHATWVAPDFWPIDTTYFVEPRSGIDLRWLFFLLDWLPLKSLDSATGVPGLNRNDAYRLPINYFPAEIDTQKLIANILDAIDDAVVETDAVIEKLNLVREGLVHDVLTFGIREDGSRRGREAATRDSVGASPQRVGHLSNRRYFSSCGKWSDPSGRERCLCR